MDARARHKGPVCHFCALALFLATSLGAVVGCAEAETSWFSSQPSANGSDDDDDDQLRGTLETTDGARVGVLDLSFSPGSDLDPAHLDVDVHAARGHELFAVYVEVERFPPQACSALDYWRFAYVDEPMIPGTASRIRIPYTDQRWACGDEVSLAVYASVRHLNASGADGAWAALQGQGKDATCSTWMKVRLPCD